MKSPWFPRVFRMRHLYPRPPQAEGWAGDGVRGPAKNNITKIFLNDDTLCGDVYTTMVRPEMENSHAA